MICRWDCDLETRHTNTISHVERNKHNKVNAGVNILENVVSFRKTSRCFGFNCADRLQGSVLYRAGPATRSGSRARHNILCSTTSNSNTVS